MEALVGGELNSDGGAREGAGEQRRSSGWWHWRSKGGWRGSGLSGNGKGVARLRVRGSSSELGAELAEVGRNSTKLRSELGAALRRRRERSTVMGNWARWLRSSGGCWRGAVRGGAGSELRRWASSGRGESWGRVSAQSKWREGAVLGAGGGGAGGWAFVGGRGGVALADAGRGGEGVMVTAKGEERTTRRGLSSSTLKENMEAVVAARLAAVGAGHGELGGEGGG